MIGFIEAIKAVKDSNRIMSIASQVIYTQDDFCDIKVLGESAVSYINKSKVSKQEVDGGWIVIHD